MTISNSLLRHLMRKYFAHNYGEHEMRQHYVKCENRMYTKHSINNVQKLIQFKLLALLTSPKWPFVRLAHYSHKNQQCAKNYLEASTNSAIRRGQCGKIFKFREGTLIQWKKVNELLANCSNFCRSRGWH